MSYMKCLQQRPPALDMLCHHVCAAPLVLQVPKYGFHAFMTEPVQMFSNQQCTSGQQHAQRAQDSAYNRRDRAS
jgi:hypothetical protein